MEGLEGGGGGGGGEEEVISIYKEKHQNNHSRIHNSTGKGKTSKERDTMYVLMI